MSAACCSKLSVPSLAVAVTACLVALPAGYASAQGLFDLFFGNARRAPPRRPKRCRMRRPILRQRRRYRHGDHRAMRAGPPPTAEQAARYPIVFVCVTDGSSRSSSMPERRARSSAKHSVRQHRPNCSAAARSNTRSQRTAPVTPVLKMPSRIETGWFRVARVPEGGAGLTSVMQRGSDAAPGRHGCDSGRLGNGRWIKIKSRRAALKACF